MSSTFDPEQRERELATESTSWDTSSPADAVAGDIPVVDVGSYFASGDSNELERVAADLRHASENVGFHQLVGHGIERSLIDSTFDEVRRFHALPTEAKSSILMDRPDWPIRGSGYLPFGERKLPRREKGNRNEAFLVKSDRSVDLADNQWLDETTLPGFREAVERYAHAVSALAMRLLPVYAVALELDESFLDSAFKHPFWRLRMTHYPPNPPLSGDDEFGIAPHVDTTFFTLLLQDGPGLTIFSHERQQWISVPVVDDAFVVNSGELLRQWSNDRFLSTRHFANNATAGDRYSIPFFFNATADFPMACLPSCHGPENPPKYPTISYLESQGVVQGE